MAKDRRRDRGDARPPEGAADVERPTLPPQSSGSGSIEVQFSQPALPAMDALEEPTDVSRAPTTDAARAAQPAIEPQGGAPEPELEDEPEHAKSSARLVARRAEELIGQGVSKIGEGIGTLGEGVTKIGERAAKVPVFGESVRQLGEGITELGASLHDLPAVTQSKRGRVLVRSMLVAYILVFAWIAGIVLLQLRDSGKPDFRPMARAILVAIRDGKTAEVWADASPRFQEVVREQRFVDDMADMRRTLGAFREIAAINETIVTTGPSGRIGRVTLTLQFDKGRARASVSFHRDERRWKLLGIVVDTPPELPITQESRKVRAELPDEVRASALEVLQAGNEAPPSGPGPGPARPSPTRTEEERDRQSERVWDKGSRVFQSSTSKEEFVRLQRERHQTLGDFVRVIEYRSGSKKYAELNATFTGLVEYRSGVVSVSLTFGRTDELAPWLLNSFKVVLPMPRPDELVPEDQPEPAPAPTPTRTRRAPRANEGAARPAPAGPGPAPAPAPATPATDEGLDEAEDEAEAPSRSSGAIAPPPKREGAPGSGAPPPKAGGSDSPPKAGAGDPPPNAGAGDPPSKAGAGNPPPNAGAGDPPPNAGAGDPPPKAGGNVAPPQTGASPQPPQAGASAQPLKAGTSAQLPSAGTSATPP
ncbi:MAG: DUF4019 domain-containing protein [Kofleriaceae bacterium]